MTKPKRDIRANKAEKLNRVRIIQEYLVLGKNPKDIVSQVSKAWDITPRMAQYYMRVAFADFKQMSGQDIEALRGYHIQARAKLLDWAMQNEKRKTFALEVLQDMARLQGLYVHKTDITSNGEKMNLVQVFLPDNGRDGSED